MWLKVLAGVIVAQLAGTAAAQLEETPTFTIPPRTPDEVTPEPTTPEETPTFSIPQPEPEEPPEEDPPLEGLLPLSEYPTELDAIIANNARYIVAIPFSEVQEGRLGRVEEATDRYSLAANISGDVIDYAIQIETDKSFAAFPVFGYFENAEGARNFCLSFLEENRFATDIKRGEYYFDETVRSVIEIEDILSERNYRDFPYCAVYPQYEFLQWQSDMHNWGRRQKTWEDAIKCVDTKNSEWDPDNEITKQCFSTAVSIFGSYDRFVPINIIADSKTYFGRLIEILNPPSIETDLQ